MFDTRYRIVFLCENVSHFFPVANIETGLRIAEQACLSQAVPQLCSVGVSVYCSTCKDWQPASTLTDIGCYICEWDAYYSMDREGFMTEFNYNADGQMVWFDGPALS